MKSGKDFSIAQTAKLSGLAASAIRYYEDQGLLARATQRVNGRRIFDEAAIADLSLLSDLRLAGMTLADIKSFQTQRRTKGATCTSLAQIALERAKHLRNHIQHMRKAEERLRNFANSCATDCNGSDASMCGQIEKMRA
jgi:DNA-binding transcriptional MerR regulator